MAYLVDTDVLIDVSRDEEAAIDFLDQLDDFWLVSIITAMELTQGMYPGCRYSDYQSSHSSNLNRNGSNCDLIGCDPRDLFSLVDPQEPVDWVTELGDDGERYSYPPPLNRSVSLRASSMKRQRPLQHSGGL